MKTSLDTIRLRKASLEILREMLYRLGFYKLQRSIFVHPYPCENEIELIRDVFRIPAHEIIIIVAELVPQEARLKKFFHL